MKLLKTGILRFLFLWLIVGVVYPLMITGIAQLAFPNQADGSLIRYPNGKIIGSGLIGQPFTSPGYFWSRPSETSDFPYNPMASAGSNLGPTNIELKNRVIERQNHLIASGMNREIPSDLVMASASGLDPDISLEGALAQIPRVAKASGIDEEKIKNLVLSNTDYPSLLVLRSARVNVLKLNLALDYMRIKNNDS